MYQVYVLYNLNHLVVSGAHPPRPEWPDLDRRRVQAHHVRVPRCHTAHLNEKLFVTVLPPY